MEELKHECGVAMIRLLKPLSYYEQKYGSWRYGFNKLYLMMEKQHNRGQVGRYRHRLLRPYHVHRYGRTSSGPWPFPHE